MSEIQFKCLLIREPLVRKSDDWRDTCFAWRVLINDESFEYYTGAGLVKQNSIPKTPTVEDVMYSLVMDSIACEISFDEWCNDFGYDTDSRSALDIYLACQRNTSKLRKAGIDIELWSERLQDY